MYKITGEELKIIKLLLEHYVKQCMENNCLDGDIYQLAEKVIGSLEENYNIK